MITQIYWMIAAYFIGLASGMIILWMIKSGDDDDL